MRTLWRRRISRSEGLVRNISAPWKLRLIWQTAQPVHGKYGIYVVAWLGTKTHDSGLIRKLWSHTVGQEKHMHESRNVKSEGFANTYIYIIVLQYCAIACFSSICYAVVSISSSKYCPFTPILWGRRDATGKTLIQGKKQIGKTW